MNTPLVDFLLIPNGGVLESQSLFYGIAFGALGDFQLHSVRPHYGLTMERIK